MIKILNNFIIKASKRLKRKNGMTLVEVVIAFFIIAIISTVLVRGTITAVNTMRINKSKTEALAIANEKIEILKAIDYSKILTAEDEITEDEDEWIFADYPQLTEDEFDVTYNVSWVDGDEDSYKQLKVTVFGGYMIIPIGVITQVYPPVGEEATGGNIYPPPEDLTLFSDEGDGESREIILNWVAPDTERTILRYNVYRDSVFLKSSLIEYCSDYPGDNNTYTYHVTAVYEGDTESVKSNSVTTGTPFVYPPPENLVITGYSGGIDEGRTVHIAWSAPDTELIIVEYQVYRGGEYIESTIDLNYQSIIGTDDYAFYIRVLYEGDNLSETSNSVITVFPMPPQNLEITGYSSGGNNKTVHLAWSTPDTEAIIVEYQVYRDGLLVGSTTGLTYSNIIGKTDYTFYIKALYEFDNLSEPSNSVSTN